MARSKKVDTVTKFNKGLFTEAGPMTFPAEASWDELNFTLKRDGSRRKRLGLAGNGPDIQAPDSPEYATAHYEWFGAGSLPGANLLVVQVGSFLYFFNQAHPDSFTDGLLRHTIDLTTAASPSLGSPSLVREFAVSMTSINGALVVASQAIDTFSVFFTDTQLEEKGSDPFIRLSVPPHFGYDPRSITRRIAFFTRDFSWQNLQRSGYSDYTTYNKINIEPGRYSPDNFEGVWGSGGTTAAGWHPDYAPYISRRIYDTINAGWIQSKGAEALNTFLSNFELPPLTHPFYTGKDANGNFTREEFFKYVASAPGFGNGSLRMPVMFPRRDLLFYGYSAEEILAFEQDHPLQRFIPAGYQEKWVAAQTTPYFNINVLQAEQHLDWAYETNRFSTVCAFAGRVFYAGLSSGANASRIFFSQASETSESIGELCQVNDPTSEYAPDILDTDGGFISIPSLVNVRALHVFGASLMVFAENGVWQISGVDDVFRATGYSVSKISDFGVSSVEHVVDVSNQPYWLSGAGIYTINTSQNTGALIAESVTLLSVHTYFKEMSSDDRRSLQGCFDPIEQQIHFLFKDTLNPEVSRALIFDLNLGAWAPFEFSTPGVAIRRPITLSGVFSRNLVYNVIDNAGNQVVDNQGREVVIERLASGSSTPNVLYMTSSASGLGFAVYKDTRFRDFDLTPFPAFLETGPNFYGLAAGRKSLPTVTVFCGVTEEGYDESGLGFIRPSGLLVQAFFNGRHQASAAAQRAYLRPKTLASGAPSAFRNASDQSQVQIRIRGSGSNARLRFTSVPGYDTHLIGFSVESDAND